MTQKPIFDYDTIIIGSGAGGSPAASILARAGKKVAIVERGAFGGQSPNTGDIPRGAMLHAAHTYNESKAGGQFGLRTNTIGYNYPSVLSWRDKAIAHTGIGNSRYYYEKQGMGVFSGTAHFLSPNEISVHRRHLSARQFLIATGASWRTTDVAGLDKLTFYTPDTIFSLTRPPKSLFIIGSNEDAMELAYIHATFGIKVYVAETAAHILPGYDTEVSDVITRAAEGQGDITLFTQTKVVSIIQDGIYKRVTFVRGGHEHSVRVDEILMANTCTPNTDIGLENAGVAYDSRGITVGPTLQTSARHIFAAGNVTNPTLQTHSVLAQSRVAAHNIIHPRAFSHYDDSPAVRVAFFGVEIAQAGLSEGDCRRRDLHVRASVAPLNLTVRSTITNHTDGFVKLISDKKGVLIGATIVAPHATDMINELALAIRHHLTASHVLETPRSFVSWAEAMRIAAGKLL